MNNTLVVGRTNQAETVVGKRFRLDCIDGLRALACLAVFGHHCWMNAGEPQWRLVGNFNVYRILQFGNTGVHLFLLLSGFCLFVSFAKEGGWQSFKFKEFFKRRAFRILPAYYVACCFCVALQAYLNHIKSGIQLTPHEPDLLSYVLHFFLLHGFYAPALYDINGVFWSLSLEWQFYFTFPLLCWCFHKKGPWKTVAVVALVDIAYRTIVARFFLSNDTTWDWTLCSVFAGRWLEFALGMLAAWQFVRQTPPASQRQNLLTFWCLCGASLVLATVAAQTRVFSPLNDVLWGMTYYSLLRAVLLPSSPALRLFNFTPLVWIGVISYSVYLFHMPILAVTASIVGKSIGAIALVGFMVTIPLSFLCFSLFEKPFFPRKRSLETGGPANLPSLSSVPVSSIAE